MNVCVLPQSIPGPSFPNKTSGYTWVCDFGDFGKIEDAKNNNILWSNSTNICKQKAIFFKLFRNSDSDYELKGVHMFHVLRKIFFLYFVMTGYLIFRLGSEREIVLENIKIHRILLSGFKFNLVNFGIRIPKSHEHNRIGTNTSSGIFSLIFWSE